MLQWDPSFVTGHAQIDADHRLLFQQLNRLDLAIRRGSAEHELLEVLDFLLRYARDHFAREEQVMREIQCPISGVNCAAHEKLNLQLKSWAARVQQEGPTTLLMLEVHRDMSEWLVRHILHVDCQLNLPTAP